MFGRVLNTVFGYKCVHLFKANIENTRTMCDICSKLTMNTSERSHRRHSGVFIVNFEWISHIVLALPLLDFEQVNTGWIRPNRNYYCDHEEHYPAGIYLVSFLLTLNTSHTLF